MAQARQIRTDDPAFPTTPALQQLLARDGAQPAHAALTTRTPVCPIAVPATGFLLGHAPAAGSKQGKPLHLDLAKLMAGRCLVQGSSGAGKSWLIRRIVEQASTHVGIVIVDPEGEFGNLGGHIGATSLRANALAQDGLTAAALGARHHRLNIHLDLSDLEPDARIAKAAAFFAGLLATPAAEWGHTFLVAIDEAHLLAPHIAASAQDAEIRKLGVATLTSLCSLGRKRGLAPIIATQRLAKLASSVVSELQNFLIGLNVFDRDIARAADLLGYTYDRAATLRDLPPGQFYAIGPALSATPSLIAVAGTETRHLGHTPPLLRSSGIAPDEARALLRLDELAQQGGQPGRGVARGAAQRGLDNFVLDPAAAHAVRIIAALAKISPNATTTGDLAAALQADPAAIDLALDLLGAGGLVDTIPRGAVRIARLSARLRLKLCDAHVVGLA